MKIFDIHSDLFTDIVWRRSKGEQDIFDRIHYPRLQKGGVDSIICVFWVEPAFRHDPMTRFRTIFQMVTEDLRASKRANVCRSVHDMVDGASSGKINIFLGIEGLSFIEKWGTKLVEENIENAFDDLHKCNVSHAIFVWNEWNLLASGTGSFDEPKRKGLTRLGEKAVQKANELNWILDASHLDEASFWDMHHTSSQPIMASHSNARALCNNERNLTDAQLKAIASQGGIIGLNAYSGFVDETNPTLDRFIDHAIYIANLVGPEHIAFGFDFIDYLSSYNLGSSFSGSIQGLEDVTKISDLLERLAVRGFSNKEIEAISFNNTFHFIEKHLKI
ncbi:membrane dipeptidase [Bacillus sp. FJAT-49705]|uniref:Membrane dipeptidase n=1 Tax=Cytobacillus citreus TaxID=2833586 RepID=A0ABS5NVQ1_9BACI|nr:membrane dipeptidase [Cytobacillus citreus]MBS4191872.1 membrane dipeptidase [Cytobacillus citreus]